MKKQLLIAAGALLVLGSAFSQNVRTDAPEARTSVAVESSSSDVSTRATERVLAMWQEASPAVTHLARPL
ncbi:MAG TPA: hypothetical protein VK025_01270 [Steroidobacter sp.]|jgi:hypothetical protein|nr:hypothetical protein [Steroidobacteraceae bacterium]HLS80018.1 hypothetical protein [Steroidobacter sp.]